MASRMHDHQEMAVSESPQVSLYEMASKSLVYFVCYHMLFLAISCHTTSRNFLSKWNVGRDVAADVAVKAVSGIFGILASAIGFNALMLHENAFYRLAIIDEFMASGIGYFLYDLSAMYQAHRIKMETVKNFDKMSFYAFLAKNPLMAAHHTILAVILIPIMCTRRDHEPGDMMIACAIFMEASTPFVSLRAILHNLHLRHSLVYIVNGLVMVVVFFCCRILIYPWFYHAYGASRGLTVIEAVRSTPPMCAAIMVLLLIPQIYWFCLMLKGAINIITERFRQKTD